MGTNGRIHDSGRARLPQTRPDGPATAGHERLRLALRTPALPCSFSSRRITDTAYYVNQWRRQAVLRRASFDEALRSTEPLLRCHL